MSSEIPAHLPDPGYGTVLPASAVVAEHAASVSRYSNPDDTTALDLGCGRGADSI